MAVRKLSMCGIILFCLRKTSTAMADKTLKDVSKIMQDIDLCMLTTTTAYDMLVSRPMSNNGDVEYDGNSYFFTWEDSRTVKDIKKDNHVNLTFQGKDEVFISVSGKASLINEREAMEPHWLKQLDRWFEDGLDTPGVVMIVVKADRIKYWQNRDEGEVKI